MNKGGCFHDLYTPSLEEVGQNLSDDLSLSFENVNWSVIECPNLTEEPFCLSTEGICGSVIVADVGGVRNLVPHPKLDRIYDMLEITAKYNKPNVFICGAGAGPFHRIGSNCEMVPNVKFENGRVISNHTLLAVVKNNKNSTFETDLTEFGILGQFHCCEGNSGKVLKVSLNRRTKEGSVLSFIQESLMNHYSGMSSPLYISGIILMECGTAKIHVMPDFTDEPLDNDDKINEWLRFFDVPAPFIGFAVIASHDPKNLGLRLEHCHGFSHDRTVAGHFHYDLTPDIVKYTAYFTVAERCLRQDGV